MCCEPFQITVLVVDDDPDIRETVVHALTSRGMRCVTAKDGIQAEFVLATTTVDLIITDLFMPNADGIEVIRLTRNQARYLPILAMSGNSFDGTMDYLDVAKKLGADAVLSKPFRRQELLEMVTRLLADAPR